MRIRAHFRSHIIGLVTFLLVGVMIFSGCCDGGEPVGPTDTQPPDVDIYWEPFIPEHGDSITFYVIADDDRGILQLAIGVNGQWEVCYEDMSGCEQDMAQTSNVQCHITRGPYSQGETLQFQARALDCGMNEARSHIQNLIVGP